MAANMDGDSSLCSHWRCNYWLFNDVVLEKSQFNNKMELRDRIGGFISSLTLFKK